MLLTHAGRSLLRLVCSGGTIAVLRTLMSTVLHRALASTSLLLLDVFRRVIGVDVSL